MIRALALMWRSFWSAFRAGYAKTRQPDPKALAEAQRVEAEEALLAAMRRYDFTERDRTRQAGRES